MRHNPAACDCPAGWLGAFPPVPLPQNAATHTKPFCTPTVTDGHVGQRVARGGGLQADCIVGCVHLCVPHAHLLAAIYINACGSDGVAHCETVSEQQRAAAWQRAHRPSRQQSALSTAMHNANPSYRRCWGCPSRRGCSGVICAPAGCVVRGGTSTLDLQVMGGCGGHRWQKWARGNNAAYRKTMQ